MKLIKNKNSFIWTVFILTIIIVIIDVIMNFMQISSFLNLVNWLTLFFPVILLFLHATWTFTLRRGLFFIFYAAIVGFIYEVIGVKYGEVFGGAYFYDPQHLGITLWGVPLLIPFFWAVFIYTGYTITSSFLSWLRLNKPAKTTKHSLWFLFPLVLIDALIVVSIDLFMDPLLVYVEFWTWVDKGPYFGIPIGNFIGWGTVTILVSGTFRVIEYFYSQEKSYLNTDTQLIPVAGYAALCFTFILCALSIQYLELAIIGACLMMPVFVANIILYSKRNRTLRV